MALKGHLDPREKIADQRSGARRSLQLTTSGTIPGSSEGNVTVHNISETGLLLETSLPLEQGEALMIELPQVGQTAAAVVWQSGDFFGCAFEQAIGQAELAAAQLSGGAPVDTVNTSKAAVPAPAQTLIGSRLNALRRKRGLTLAQVASALGVSKPTVWAWEKGKARPLPERYEAIADALGVTPTELDEISAPKGSDVALEDCRIRIATAYGIAPDKVKIMIEL